MPASAPASSSPPPDLAGGHPFDAVLFDLDGTLIDSTASVRRAWEAWAHREGLDPAGPTAMVGRPAREIVAALVAPSRVEDALTGYSALAATSLDGVEVLPGTVAAVDASRGRCAVVTSSARTIALARLGHCGLEPDWPMVTADDVEAGKPDPEPFRRGAAALGVDPRRCLAVEDSGAGVRSARAAGCHVVALHHGGDASGLDDAHVVVRDLAGLTFRAGSAGIGVTLAGD